MYTSIPSETLLINIRYGIELAERLLEHEAGLIVVFVTAYQEYAVKAFEVNAIDYILKPVRFDRLSKTMNRIINSNTMSFNHADSLKPLKMTLFKQVMIEELQRPLLVNSMENHQSAGTFSVSTSAQRAASSKIIYRRLAMD
ncbi:response regulator [Paenibacillus sp. UASWS1643]|uniref:response regulator n=1 Tax=Paenibacillus sp. UASWS1643 TaxID=2580422 RepID=UPI001239D5DD|nr:response regulator [Paenibacillus sp. UASWS1643]KAA8748107.1 response regulator [Paenibacillus sp. UASWS1643]